MSRLIARLMGGLIRFLIPILLVLLSVRLVLTPAYLNLSYRFLPPDEYGWDRQVRLDYGPYGVKYLLNDAEISYLGDLVIEGEKAFTPRELDHMEDVKQVTRGALKVLNISLLLFLLCAFFLGISAETRPLLWQAIQAGGLNTVAIIGLLLLLVLLSWDFFFDGFHSLFFADGTWQFYLNDTLIRLYPQTFWFGSSLFVGLLTLVGALLCWGLPRFWRQKPL